MPRRVILRPDLKTRKVSFELYDAAGVKVEAMKCDPLNKKHQAAVSGLTGADTPTVLGWFDRALGQSQPDPVTIDLDDPTRPTMHIWDRTLDTARGPAPTNTLYTDGPQVADWLKAALASFGTDRLLDWDDDESLCCLDADYHNVTPPPAEWVQTTAATRLVPVPVVYHMSRGGGLHAFYTAVPGILSAREVASLAALRWRELDPTAGVELKTQVRGPGTARVYEGTAADALAGLKRAAGWLGGDRDDGDDRSGEWLDQHGMERGQRYDHDRCPINPSATGERQPVTVGDAGVYCFVCDGHGNTLPGCSKPGFAPWSVLTADQDRPAGVLGQLVRNLTHWGHARLVIQAATGLAGPLVKAAYRAALKVAHHGTDKELLVPLAFDRNTDVMARLSPGRWATDASGTSFTFPTTIVPLLSTLPACCAVVEGKDGPQVKANAATINLFQQPTIDLTERGYAPVEVIRGVRMHRAYRDTTRLVVPATAPWLKGIKSSMHPRYVEPGKRPGDAGAKARELVERTMPGVDWRYVEALLLARACNEARIGLQQHLLVTGVSGAGKSSHVMLAAGILGDVATPVVFAADTDRFRSSVRDASFSGSFIAFDEFMKDSLRANRWLAPEQALEPLLNFTPESLSHKLHLGPMPLGHVGVCVWTETWIPEALRAHTQIARRVHYIDLRNKLDWVSGLSALGLSKPYEIRTADQDHADACNVILSEVMDEYLTTPQAFDTLANRIGITTLSESTEFHDPTTKLLAFFELVAAAPDLDEANRKRFSGAGFKVISRGGSGDLYDLWCDLCDGGDDSQWKKSTKISGEDWGQLLGVPKQTPVHFDILDAPNRVAVRFRVGPSRTPVAVNSGIRDLIRKDV